MNVHNRLCAQGEVGPTLCDTISPWNPDYNCNGIIDIGDALPFFDVWATSFTPDTAIAILENLDPDPTNELQWLLLDGDTLRLMLADSTIYSSVYIGGADGADGANGLSAYELWLEAGNSGSVEDFLASLVGATGADGKWNGRGRWYEWYRRSGWNQRAQRLRSLARSREHRH